MTPIQIGKHRGLWLLLAWLLPLCLFSRDTIQVNKLIIHQPLEKVLKDFQEEYKVLFAYNPNEIEDIFVHSHIDDQNIDQAIKKILNETGLEYIKGGDNQMLVRRKNHAEMDKSVIIRGTISSLENEPLAWASIHDMGSGYGTYSDEEGNFILKIIDAPASGAVKISYLGYADSTMVWNRSTKSLGIRLNNASFELAQVEVIDRIPTLPILQSQSRYKSQSKNLKIRLGALGMADPLSQLKFLPGVNPTTDLKAGIKIRGGGENENLYIMDGIEFFHVDHFFGIFSTFNDKILDSTIIHFSDFPIEHGGRTSGVVEMHLTDPAGKELSGEIGLHTLYSSFNIETRLTKKSGVAFAFRGTNGRVNNSDLFQTIIENDTEPNQGRTIGKDKNELYSIVPNFGFADAVFKWQYKPSNQSTFQVSLFAGRDQYNAQYSLDYNRRINGLATNIKENYQETVKWENNGIALQYIEDVNEDWRTSIDVSGTGFRLSLNLNADLKKQTILRADSVSISNWSYNQITGGYVKWKNRFRIDDKKYFNLGIEYDNYIAEIQNSNENRVNFISRDSSYSFTWFGDYNFPISSEVTGQIGVRSTYYNNNQKTYLSPRMALNWQPNNKWTFGVTSGYYYQYLRNLYYEDRLGKTHELWLLANENIPVLTSLHFNIHSQYKAGNWGFRSEYFNKSSFDLLEQAWLVKDFDDEGRPITEARPTLLSGRGNSHGLDLLLDWRYKNFNTYLSYTLSQSTISIEEIDNGNSFPSAEDRRHQLSLNGQYTWNKWTLGAAVIYASGKPYVSALTFDEDRTTLTVDERIERLDDYLRADLAVNYNFNIRKQNFDLGLSIFNVFNRSNTEEVQYLYELQGIDDNGSLRDAILGSEIQLIDRTYDLYFEWNF